MTEERDPYIEILADWSPNPRDLERVMRKFTPEDLVLLLDALGSPKEAITFLGHSKKLVSEMMWREEMRAKLGKWAKAFLIVGGIVGVINTFIVWVLLKWPG